MPVQEIERNRWIFEYLYIQVGWNQKSSLNIVKDTQKVTSGQKAVEHDWKVCKKVWKKAEQTTFGSNLIIKI